MSNVSAFEDIRDRLEESVSPRCSFRPLDSVDPQDFVFIDGVFAAEIEALHLRVESYALAKPLVAETAPQITKLCNRNEKNRAQIRELRAELTVENAERSLGRVDWLEKVIAEILHDIVDLTLTATQKHNVAKFERRLINGRPYQNHCYHCKTDFVENSQNYCIDCGHVKCACGHCYCNFGAT